MAKRANPDLRTLMDDAPTVTGEAVTFTALEPQAEQGALLFERLARDPNVNVEKLGQLMDLWERGETRRAQAAFSAAMNAAQEEMEPVRADSFNPQTKSKFASYEALDRALRPVYTRHGFGLTFDTGETAIPEYIRLICQVVHSGGFTKDYHLDMPADGKGAKGGDVMTKTHATASAVSYGMRYLLRMIFNIAIDDDDGNKAGGKRPDAKDERIPDPPDAQYAAWWEEMEAVVIEGIRKLKETFNASKPEYRSYATKYYPEKWEALKDKATAITRQATESRP
jgi:hypothetical protein